VRTERNIADSFWLNLSIHGGYENNEHQPEETIKKREIKL